MAKLFDSEVPVVEGKCAPEGAPDANGHHDDPLVDGDSGWGRGQLMEDRTVEKPIVRIDDPCEKFDEKGPRKNPVHSARCQAWGDAPRQCANAQKKYRCGHGVQSSAKEAWKTDRHMLAGDTKPGEDPHQTPLP